MATNPRVVADFETSISTAVSVGSTTFSLATNLDDDGVAIANGNYCFTVDNGSSVKEYLYGALSGTSVTSVQSISRQGVLTTGAARAHRVGASCIITDFITIKNMADILNGVGSLPSATPLIYDTAPSLTDGKQVATVAYVLSVVTGGSVSIGSVVVAGTAGESVTLGQAGYFKTSDQRWYSARADTSTTYAGVKLGIFTTSATVGNTVNVQLAGIVPETGLTAGSRYYIPTTPGAITLTPPTVAVPLGWATSTTGLLLDLGNSLTPTKTQKDALDAAVTAPTTSNPFVTASDLTSGRLPTISLLTSSGTFNVPASVTKLYIRLVGGGGGSSTNASGNGSTTGGAGGYSEGMLTVTPLAAMGYTVGAAGVTAGSAGTGTAGGTTTFSTISATGGGGATGGGTGTPGAGGVGSGGTVNIPGGSGTNAILISGSNYAPAVSAGSVLGPANSGGYGSTATAGAIIVSY